ncbi:MAG: hypothetical protein ACI9LU_002131 [Polaribacter sp.]|jgi:hypothetical protein
MNNLIRIFVVLPALLFLLIGIRWLVDPTGAAAELGMPLLEGLGRSTQIGDLTAFFIGASIMMGLGLMTANRTWFYAPAMLLILTAGFRVVAWFAHDAVFAAPQIGVEVIVAGILVLAASKLCKPA